MTLQDLGNMSQFIGGIAIVISLVYLAIQMRQNTRVHSSAAYHQAAEQIWIAASAVMQSPSMVRRERQAYAGAPSTPTTNSVSTPAAATTPSHACTSACCSVAASPQLMGSSSGRLCRSRLSRRGNRPADLSSPSVKRSYSPTSSFKRSGLSFCARSSIAAHRGSSSTTISMPRLRRTSSPSEQISLITGSECLTRCWPTRTREMLCRAVVPEHITHGLCVETKVSCRQSRRRPACRIHTTSACAVESPLWNRSLWPRATIFPARSASTEPIGMPPSAQDFSACSTAASIRA